MYIKFNFVIVLMLKMVCSVILECDGLTGVLACVIRIKSPFSSFSPCADVYVHYYLLIFILLLPPLMFLFHSFPSDDL